jgi:MjaI restriction endonuclease.
MKDSNIIKIENKDIMSAVLEKSIDFPKYTTQIINLANQNSKGTRPEVVGKLSDLIHECPSKGYVEWEEWYTDKNPDAIDNATRKIMPMIENLKEAMELIDEKMVRMWVKDLVITKTFFGLNVQEGILKTISKLKNTTYRLANSSEESRGIDGYLGDTPVSIKPLTYKTKNMLSEVIDVKIIYYEKKTGSIEVHIPDL